MGHVDHKLGVNVYKIFKRSHIKVNVTYCKKCENKYCLHVCPADLYSEVDGEIKINYEGCLECGTCRIVCEYIEWDYPEGGFGVQYRFG